MNIKTLFKKRRSGSADKETNQRITTKTVEEVRRDVLDKGKKFKYPVQYEKHKVVINAIVVSVIGLIIAIVVAWWSLYRANSDSLVLFKLTQVLPLSVGQIDGEPIKFSDYLAQYRSSTHYYQAKEDSLTDQDSINRLKQQFRKQAFDNATYVALANKLARQHDITISKEEFEEDLNSKLSFDGSKMSQDALDSIMRDNYGLDRGEYQKVFIHNPLLIRKVSFAIDEDAKQLANTIKDELSLDGSNFQDVAEKHQANIILTESELVKHANNDGGRAPVALGLSVGQVAGPIESTSADGYYFIKLLAKDDSTVSYQTILVSLSKFGKLVTELSESGGLKVYAKLDIKPIE